MGNKKYYRKNNNYNKNNYYYKKNKNNKKNYYYMNKNNVTKNNIDYNVNNNLGDVNINKEDNDYTIDNEIIENDFEVVLKKKDKNIDDNTISFDNVEKEDIKEENQNNININVNEEVEIQKKPRKNLLIKTNLGYALGIIILLLAIVGTTYSYFNYTGNTRQADIASGDIYVKVVEDTVNLSGKLYPSTKEEARSKSDNVVTFNVKGLNTSDKTIYYEVKLNYGESKSSPYLRFNDSDLMFDLVEVSGSNETYLVNAKSFNDISNGVRIWADNIPANTTTEVTKTYKLRMWLSDKVTIDDNNGTYPASTYKNYYASIKASVFGDFTEKEPPLDARGKLAKLAQPDTEINFGNNSSDTNGKGLYKLGNTDILYYRGEVNNNNVVFGGFCWQIVRTTDTGGIKMIYNGVVTGTTENPTCENTAANDRQLASTTSFNSSLQSMSDVGYMYNKRYEFGDTAPTTGAYFGSEVNFDDTTNKYTLIGANVTAPDASHHYSCDLTNAQGSCATVRYYYYVSDSTYRYINLTDGEKVEDAIYKMTGNGDVETKAKVINQNYELNTTNSAVKMVIDNWYQSNLNSYTSYLEDTIYCNDRSFQIDGNNTILKSGWNPNADNITGNGGLSTIVYFNARTRFSNSGWYSTTNVPTFTCPNEMDRFTVSSENGNGKLTYPVGLLTSDEIALAGAAGNASTSNDSYYLYTGNVYWSESPSDLYSNYAREFTVRATGNLDHYRIANEYGVRPVVSLKSGTEFEDGGEGTTLKPYVVRVEPVAKITPQISASADDVIWGENVIVNVTLPIGVPGTVRVTVDNDLLAEEYYNGGNNGELEISIVSYSDGPHDCELMFIPDDTLNYNSATVEFSFNVNKLDPGPDVVIEP